jgi:hypothetical protein
LLPVGPDQGTFVLKRKGAAGTVTIKLIAIGGGNDPTGLPVRYSYQIIGGTGN